MARKKMDYDIPKMLRWKVLEGMNNSEIGERLGVSASTVGNHLKGKYHPKSLANAIYRDYVKNWKKSKISRKSSEEIRKWLELNIVELSAIGNNIMSVGQTQDSTKRWTYGGNDFVGFFDWFTVQRDMIDE